MLTELTPISDAPGYAAEAYPFAIADLDRKRVVMNVLGAGATIPGAVQRLKEDGRYVVSTDLYKTLLMMRAAAIPAFHPEAIAGSGYGRRSENELAPTLARRALSSEPRALGPPLGHDNDEGEPASAVQPEAVALNLLRSELIQKAALQIGSDGDYATAADIAKRDEPINVLRSISDLSAEWSDEIAKVLKANQAKVRQAFAQVGDSWHDQQRLLTLKSVADELEYLMPLLMLVRGGAYEQRLEDLVETLNRDAAELKLGHSDRLLLSQALKQLETLRNVAPTPDRLAEVVRLLASPSGRNARRPLNGLRSSLR